MNFLNPLLCLLLFCSLWCSRNWQNSHLPSRLIVDPCVSCATQLLCLTLSHLQTEENIPGGATREKHHLNRRER